MRSQYSSPTAALPETPIMLDDYQRASTELPPIATRLVEQWGEQIRDQFLFATADPYPAFHGPRAA